VVLGDESDDHAPDTGALRREIVQAQRTELAELYRTGEIGEEIRRSISRGLDLQEQRPFS
jgi:hypothetical protein